MSNTDDFDFGNFKNNVSTSFMNLIDESNFKDVVEALCKANNCASDIAKLDPKKMFASLVTGKSAVELAKIDHFYQVLLLAENKLSITEIEQLNYVQARAVLAGAKLAQAKKITHSFQVDLLEKAVPFIETLKTNEKVATLFLKGYIAKLSDANNYNALQIDALLTGKASIAKINQFQFQWQVDALKELDTEDEALRLTESQYDLYLNGDLDSVKDALNFKPGHKALFDTFKSLNKKLSEVMKFSDEKVIELAKLNTIDYEEAIKIEDKHLEVLKKVNDPTVSVNNLLNLNDNQIDFILQGVSVTVDQALTVSDLKYQVWQKDSNLNMADLSSLSEDQAKLVLDNKLSFVEARGASNKQVDIILNHNIDAKAAIALADERADLIIKHGSTLAQAQNFTDKQVDLVLNHSVLAADAEKLTDERADLIIKHGSTLAQAQNFTDKQIDLVLNHSVLVADAGKLTEERADLIIKHGSTLAQAQNFTDKQVDLVLNHSVLAADAEKLTDIRANLIITYKADLAQVQKLSDEQVNLIKDQASYDQVTKLSSVKVDLLKQSYNIDDIAALDDWKCELLKSKEVDVNEAKVITLEYKNLYDELTGNKTWKEIAKYSVNKVIALISINNDYMALRNEAISFKMANKIQQKHIDFINKKGPNYNVDLEKLVLLNDKQLEFITKYSAQLSSNRIDSMKITDQQIENFNSIVQKCNINAELVFALKEWQLDLIQNKGLDYLQVINISESDYALYKEGSAEIVTKKLSLIKDGRISSEQAKNIDPKVVEVLYAREDIKLDELNKEIAEIWNKDSIPAALEVVRDCNVPVNKMCYKKILEALSHLRTNKQSCDYNTFKELSSSQQTALSKGIVNSLDAASNYDRLQEIRLMTDKSQAEKVDLFNQAVKDGLIYAYSFASSNAENSECKFSHQFEVKESQKWQSTCSHESIPQNNSLQLFSGEMDMCCSGDFLGSVVEG